MNELLTIFGGATLLLAFGLWLMLPRAGSWGRPLGTVMTASSLGIFASQLPGLGNWVADSLFYLLAALTVFAAVGTVTFRKPVYCAIWFGLSLLGTAGLFLLQGAQFLGVATVVVYAGAILVTFLFVLMLAQPEGQAPYDRVSWGGWLSAASGALVVGVLALAIVSVFQNPDTAARPVVKVTPSELQGEVLAEQHVAHLGAQLFSKYLVEVEVAGTLLLVALVGTVAIVAQLRKLPGGARYDG